MITVFKVSYLVLFLLLYCIVNFAVCMTLPQISSSARSKLRTLSRGGDDVIPRRHYYKKNDLWIVGAGMLGVLVAEAWLQNFPGSKVIAETKTQKNHRELLELGVIPRSRSDRSDMDKYKSKNVIICIPPYTASGETEHYLSEISLAADLWSGSDQGNNAVRFDPHGDITGMLLLISSTAVYGEAAKGIVTERTEVDRSMNNSRVLRSVLAEDLILSRQGAILRLAGLYTARRGPHMYWLNAAKAGRNTLSLDSNGVICLISYEDAAVAAVRAIQRGQMCQIYLAADDAPLSRGEILRIATASKYFPDSSMPEFRSPPINQLEKQNTKRIDSRWTRSVLGWEPNFKSFEDFMLAEQCEML